MASWDRRTPDQNHKQQEAAVKSQVLDAVGPFSPWWRERFGALGRTPADAASVAGLAALPAFGERDLCPDGDPATAAGLVLQADEQGFALHAHGPALRRSLALRMAAPDSYRRLIEADTRPTSFVWAGLGVRFPVASTRTDLDVIARVGARLWAVLGLTADDLVVSALSGPPTATAQALHLAALAAGCPAMAPGPALSDLLTALALLPATVLVVEAAAAAGLLEALDDGGADLTGLTTLLCVGALGDDERQASSDALSRVGAAAAVVLALHVPEGHRLPWAECRTGGGPTGLHTYPDLDVVGVVDAETGEATDAPGGELVLTQLELRGSALLRWRTGDLVASIATAPCPACGRTVPRLLEVQRGALVPEMALRPALARRVDLRGVSGALTGRADVAGWTIVTGPSPRDGFDELLVHVVPVEGADPAEVAIGVARDVRAGSGLLPTQVVLARPGELPVGGTALLPRVVRRPPVVRTGPGGLGRDR